MGRYIECEVNGECHSVWKYRFASQESEMYRIFTELKIGEYSLLQYVLEQKENEPNYKYISIYKFKEWMEIGGDRLILNRKDCEKLKIAIEKLKQSLTNKDEWYMRMLEAIVNFINKHKEQERFIFHGEL
ncbi:hypothetical protein [Crocosphaera sp. Alani8]|uniref:hypothetical protein n=1 Tax=Crocosphaera sp. Alani8 TaxID=3038952 RepID=UPI00313AC31A